MNIAVIFAGGVGKRMHTKEKPKQFLEIYNKPIIVHTLEKFEKHKDIDGIVIVCVENWISYMNDLVYKYRLEKVKKIVPGGETGQLSIYHGLCAAKEISGDEKSIVLIHDGVRPLIDKKLISDNIKSVQMYGSAITTAVVKETILVVDTDAEKIDYVPSRANSRVAKAPQSFWLDDILHAHQDALKKAVEEYIQANNTCALATAAGDFVRCTPLEYTYHDDCFWIFSEGGEKFYALEKNKNVCLVIFDKYEGFGKLKGMQVTGLASIVEPFSQEYVQAADFRKIPLKALEKMLHPMNLIKIKPKKIEFVNSDFKKDGADSRQTLVCD